MCTFGQSSLPVLAFQSGTCTHRLYSLQTRSLLRVEARGWVFPQKRRVHDSKRPLCFQPRGPNKEFKRFWDLGTLPTKFCKEYSLTRSDMLNILLQTRHKYTPRISEQKPTISSCFQICNRKNTANEKRNSSPLIGCEPPWAFWLLVCRCSKGIPGATRALVSVEAALHHMINACMSSIWLTGGFA